MPKIYIQFLIYLLVCCWITLLYILESPENVSWGSICANERPLWNKILYIFGAILSVWCGLLLYEMHSNLKEIEAKQQLIGISLIELRAQKLQMERITDMLRHFFEHELKMTKSSHKTSLRKPPKFMPNWFKKSSIAMERPPLDDGVVVLYKKQSNPSLFVVSTVVAKVAARGLQKLAVHVGEFIYGVGHFLVMLVLTGRQQPSGTIKRKRTMPQLTDGMGDQTTTTSAQQVRDENMKMDPNYPDEECESLSSSCMTKLRCLGRNVLGTSAVRRLKSAFDSIKPT